MKKYTKTHEWVVVEDKVATVGITNHAQEQPAMWSTWIFLKSAER